MSWKPAFAALCQKTHSEQGIWFLNGFWTEGAEGYKEDIWKIVHNFIECQIDGPVLYGNKKFDFKEDSDLDEFKSHRVLEIMGETLTVVALRKRLQELDIDQNKRMSLTEYLLNKYKKTPQQVVNSPQGTADPAQLAAAQAACDKAANALNEVMAAEAELQASIKEIERLEKEKAAKIAACEAIIADPSVGAVKKGKAVQDKEATLAEDPLPLRKAKITQQAALRKVEKARKAAEEALAEAQEKLDALKKGGGTPMGQIWWMERILMEKKKFMKK